MVGVIGLMYFGMKYAPYRARLALIKEGIRIIGGKNEWQRKGVKDYFLRRFGKSQFF